MLETSQNMRADPIPETWCYFNAITFNTFDKGKSWKEFRCDISLLEPYI